ncbi:Scr1 family TA system antitoxin-like transcriptional regulator [Streptomyces malaysiensis]|uniref:Scr1 family TA system antitoxin-like transcriptional regulator n=1 Tax=Streptomyces malaysiensis TaxID=92644 RepID=UPI002B2A87C2|nr:Scr1 family TA system antitoxin-like transcriptional regulator [Streptomyces malaysiensis]
MPSTVSRSSWSAPAAVPPSPPTASATSSNPHLTRVAARRVWAGHLSHRVKSAAQPAIVLQVLPFTAGAHDLGGGSLSLLWQADGTGVAYFEGSTSGELIEDPFVSAVKRGEFPAP